VSHGVTGNWSYGSVVTYTCNTGYQLINGSSLECSFVHSSTLLTAAVNFMNGPIGEPAWNGSHPVCEIVACPLPTAPNNGSYEPTKARFTYLDMVNFTCENGFDLFGSNLSTCNASGQWSNHSPTCVIKDCGNLTDPVNGTVSLDSSTKFGHQAHYYCNEGYELKGASRRDCEASGNWTFESPVCDVICECNDFTIISCLFGCFICILLHLGYR